MILNLSATGCQSFCQLRTSAIETTFIFVARIKIKLDFSWQRVFFGQKERIVCRPLFACAEIMQVFIIQLLVYGRHMTTHTLKHRRMSQCVIQGDVTACRATANIAFTCLVLLLYM